MREAIMKQNSVHNDYLSKIIFNDFIFIMASVVKSVIFEEVVQAKSFTVIADECKDISKSEQMSLCLRYSIGSRPTERLVKFTHLSEGSFSAEVIAKGIEKLVTKLVEIGCIFSNVWRTVWSPSTAEKNKSTSYLHPLCSALSKSGHC